MSHGKSGSGWLVTSLLFFLGWVFMYADRTILSPVQGVIREEFLLSNAEVGLITSVFFIMYTAVQIPSGLLGDRFGRTKIILFGFMVFGAATALTHFASSFLMLILIRILAGFGEGFYYGPQYATPRLRNTGRLATRSSITARRSGSHSGSSAQATFRLASTSAGA